MHCPHCTHTATVVRDHTKVLDRGHELGLQVFGEAMLDLGEGHPRRWWLLVRPEGGSSVVDAVVYASEPVVECDSCPLKPWVAEDDIVGEVVDHHKLLVF
ncbi:hypothetical protein Zmor_028328 [Zophobas morio]|uniref:Uncharacterized protein n=1 Tax=Zophobas morio TaxID=2755281 RepID=A0AA38M459_9CUCU|nr:hypothetical protein Zmor_028328 [Zophobas morio]